MKLRSVSIQNFRCLDSVEIPFQPDLTVLIGENDSGKSSVLDIVEWVLEVPYPRTISRPHYPVDFTSPEQDVIVEMTFSRIDDNEVVPEEYIDDESNIRMRVVCPPSENSNPTFEVWTQQFQVPEVGLDEKTLSRKRNEELDDILHRLGMDPGEHSRKGDKVQAILSARQSVPTVWNWKEVSPNKMKFLPRIQRYRALEYKQPEKFLEKTLKAVATSALYSLRDTDQKLKSVRNLEDRIRKRLAQEVRQLLSFIQRILPEAKDISYDPDIHLEEALRGGDLLVDTGYGLHPLSRIGDGSKRRMVMAAMEWEREILRRIGNTTPLLRAYDEPDTNLHYNAQRVFFRAIRDIVEENPSQQAILCTHSVFMIDAAPAQCIVHLSKNTHGKTEIAILPVDEDEEIARFLENVAFQMGVRNSVLFFDRCYLLVEGETEHHALPILYRSLYGHSLAEDGIAIINLGGHGNRDALMRLLGNRRSHLVIALLDKDVIEQHKRIMLRNGWNEKQVEQAIFPIGKREFEDTFSDEAWAQTLNSVPEWVRQDESPWEPQHIAALRDPDKKFSENLVKVIWLESKVQEYDSKVSKPLLGEALAQNIQVSVIPQPIRVFFERARQIAGVEV